MAIPFQQAEFVLSAAAPAGFVRDGRRQLAFARRDMHALGIARLYLITDHTQFYERCGWKFLCPVTDDEGIAMRIYTAPTLPV